MMVIIVNSNKFNFISSDLRMSKAIRRNNKKDVFYFHEETEIDIKNQSNFLKGAKLISRNEQKITELRKRQAERANVWNLRYGSDSFDIWDKKHEQNQQQQERHRLSLQSFRPKILNQLINHPRKTRKIEDHPIMISSKNSGIIQSNKPRQMPHFISKNLEGKTNEYLNLIIRMTKTQQEEKLKEIIESNKSKDSYRKTSNIFLRNMKKQVQKSKKKETLYHERQWGSTEEIGKTKRLLQGKLSPCLSYYLDSPKLQLKEKWVPKKKRSPHHHQMKNPVLKQLKQKVKMWEAQQKESN